MALNHEKGLDTLTRSQMGYHVFMKRFDEYDMALCQSKHKGVWCDGHEGHGPIHFATVNDGAMTWTDEEKEPIQANGLCSAAGRV